MEHSTRNQPPEEHFKPNFIALFDILGYKSIFEGETP